MEIEQPRGVQEQVSAVTDLLNGEPEKDRDDLNAEEPVVEPEQDALGENLEEGADEAGDEGKPEVAEEQPARGCIS